MPALRRGRDALHSVRARVARRLDDSAALRALLVLAACVGATTGVAVLRAGGEAADPAARFGVAFAASWWVGRVLRVRGERFLGASGFAVFRDPVFEALAGALAQACAWLVASAVWKRALGLHAPLLDWAGAPQWSGLALPALALLLALAASLGPVARAMAPRRSDLAPPIAFLAVFAWTCGAHWRALAPYSSDPAQHVAWLAQLSSFGFAPDVYGQTDAPITYPLGFHAWLAGLGGVAGLLPTTLVAIAPPLASAWLVYVAVAGARALVPRANGRRATPWLATAVFAASSAALSSAQLSVWEAYEGTGRLAAGALHAVPFAVLLAAAGGVRAFAPVGRASLAGFAATLACIASGALVVLVNPTHALLHATLSATALVAALASGTARWRGVALGTAAGLALAWAMAAGDPAASRALGWGAPPDAALARVEAEFGADMPAATCASARCMAAAALRTRTLVDALVPARVLVEGPVRALLEPGLDLRRAIPFVKGPRNFPDPTGIGISPLQGWVRWILIPLPLALVLRRRDAAWLRAVGAVVVAATLDAAGRSALRAWVHADDAALRLWPDYANRASAIAFAQMLWPLVAAGAVLGTRLVRETERSRGAMGRVVPLGVAVGALALAFATAEVDLRERQAPLASAARGPTRGDVADLRALEARSVPAGEAYLVAAHVAASNRERWIAPTDPSLALYLQAGRPALFLYHLSVGARVAASDLDAACREIRGDVGIGADRVAPAPALFARARARWVALAARSAGDAERAFRARTYCGRAAAEAFPGARLVDAEGGVVLFRLF